MASNGFHASVRFSVEPVSTTVPPHYNSILQVRLCHPAAICVCVNIVHEMVIHDAHM
jgi:hypothetical protein